MDVRLVESSRREALPTYEGYRGHQPMLVVWGETHLAVADEFRDGNVPAGKDIARVVDDTYATLPYREERWKVRVRSDSAAYDQEVLDHWDGRGWKLAVSPDMSQQLRRARPKRLRFALFTRLGRVVRHVREVFIRLCARVPEGLLQPGRRRLLQAA